MKATKGAELPNSFRQSVSFFPRARDGFQHLLRSKKDSFPRVLLPGYVGWSPREGSGVLDPVLESGIRYEFYPIDKCFDPDLSQLSSLVRSGPPPIVLLIHYFGKRTELTDALRSIVQDAGGYLVEDWAHGLFSHPSSRPVGNAAIYSLHKMLPMRRGGALVGVDRTLANDPALAHEVLEYDVEGIAERRRKNFEIVLETLVGAALPESYLELPWTQLTMDAVPQSVPLFVPEHSKNHLYHSLNDVGIGVTSLYHTMADPIDEKAFPLAHEMSRRILNLPVHQDLDVETCKAIAIAVRDALTSLGDS